MSTISKAVPHVSTPTSVFMGKLIAAVADLILGLIEWRIWWVLAYGDIRQRYRRSKIGQFWLTISMMVMIAGMGGVYALIFDQPVNHYMPYLGVGLVVWNLLASLVGDLSTCFINADSYLRSYPTPRSAIIYRVIARDFLTAAHNLVIVPILLVLFSIPVTAATLLAIPGFFLVAINSVWVGMLLGPLCTRFRDLPQIITSVVQLAFFLTPVMFHGSQLDNQLWAVTHLNPFASFLEIVRAPLLGQVPPGHHYLMVAACTVIGGAMALPFYARFRGRIVYWL